MRELRRPEDISTNQSLQDAIFSPTYSIGNGPQVESSINELLIRIRKVGAIAGPGTKIHPAPLFMADYTGNRNSFFVQRANLVLAVQMRMTTAMTHSDAVKVGSKFSVSENP